MNDASEMTDEIRDAAAGNGAQSAPASRPSATTGGGDAASRGARLVLYLGVVLVGAGAIALYAGYNGAATNHLFAAQVPYMISGGFTGVALLLLGGLALVLYALLNAQAELRREVAEMREAMREVSEALTWARPVSLPSSNGHVVVARGAGTYHRADCRIVSRASGTRLLSRDEAEDKGLTACRVCTP